MNDLKKITGFNILMLLAYTVLLTFLGKATQTGQYKMVGVMMMIAGAIGAHVCILFIMSIYYFVRHDKAKGRAYLLGSLLVLVIGFSTCWGVGSLENVIF